LVRLSATIPLDAFQRVLAVYLKYHIDSFMISWL
jgi:hypothetical protein